MLKKGKYIKLFDSFNNKKVLIIGDVMVDSYIWGKVERISPEAPVPIVAVQKRANRLGGAANVAMNIKALGAEPILCSVIGEDDKGAIFMDLLEKRNLDTQGIYKSINRITTTKFRIIGSNTQMLRVDEEIDTYLNSQDYEHLYTIIENILLQNNIDAIIFQDYDKGVISPDLIKNIVSKANKLNIPVAADPKKRNFAAYKNITLFKPNLKELKEGLNLDFNHKNIDDLNRVVSLLQSKHNLDIAMVTLSEDGMFISSQMPDEDNKSMLIPSRLRSVSDVSGAGDTVISVASLCLAFNLPVEDIANISNLAGGIVCEEVGVVPIDKQKLLNEVLTLL